MIIHTPTNMALQAQGIYVRADASDWQYSWPVHTHEGLEIYYFIQGSSHYVIGNEVYDLVPGDMLLFRGSTIHRANPSKDIPYIRSYVNFTEAFLQGYLEESLYDKMLATFGNESGLLIRWNTLERDGIEQLYRSLAREYESELFGSASYIKTLLIQLLIKIYRKSIFLAEYVHSQKLSHTQINVRRILQYINHNFRESINLTNLSKTLHLNKYYMCHSFKEVTGFTINNYLMSKRIEEAKKILKSTDEPIGVISDKLGFNTTVHFSRLFKQHEGVSPQNYRKQS